MTDDRLFPDPPDDDALNRALATLPRLAPGRGFADRVLTRVRHPLPLWLVPVRDWFRGTLSGIRGWIILAVLSLATLAGWGTVGVTAWQQRTYIAEGAGIAASELAVPVTETAFGVRDVVRDVVRDRLFDWLPLAWPALKLFLILYAAVALVSAIGLWWLMRTPNTLRASALVLACFLMVIPASSLAAQDADVVAYSSDLSRGRALIALQYADGTERRILFSGGEVRVDNAVVGTYARDGVLERIWRALVGRNDLTTPQMLAALHALPIEGLVEADAATHQALLAQIAAQVPAPPAGVDVPPVPAAPEVPAFPAADAPPVQVRVADAAAPSAMPPISSVPGGLLALFGTLIALSGIALGLSFFAERQLDVMADTVQQSLGRSFFVGLFAQPLVLPVLAALIVGLTLTIVGILVVPFAIAAYIVLLAVGLVGGYLAVARATGSVFMQRRGKDPLAGGMSMVRSVMVGLAILLALWLPAVLLGWVPVMGTILRWSAGLVTWGLITTGFGAALLTRGGVRGTFGRRFRGLPAPFSQPLTIPEDDEPAGASFSTSEWLAGKRK